MFNVLSIFRNVKSGEFKGVNLESANFLAQNDGQNETQNIMQNEVQIRMQNGLQKADAKIQTQRLKNMMLDSKKGLKSAFLSVVFSSLLASGFVGGSLAAHSYYDPDSIDLEAEWRKDEALFKEMEAQDRAFKVDLREAASIDFDELEGREKPKPPRPGEEYEAHGYIHSDLKPAQYYITNSIESLFADTSDFECEGNARSAECRVKYYDTRGIILKNFRYTLDYKIDRTIERISSDIYFRPDDKYSFDEIDDFLPRRFECADFTQIKGGESKINEQLNCYIRGKYYDVQFRIRAKSSSPLFKDQYAIRFLNESSFFMRKFFNRVSDYEFSGNKDELLEGLNAMAKKTLSKIDTNIYSIELSVKKPLLPQKVYEFLFDVDEESQRAYNELRAYEGLPADRSEQREMQVTKGLYNAGVGYIYGAAMGYVIGNDELKPQTKEGLTKALMAFRDSAMVGSNVSRVTLKMTNRTKEGVNLADVFKAASEKLSKVSGATNIRKEHLGRSINSFNADILNRYRFEVGVYRLKPNAPGFDKHGF